MSKKENKDSILLRLPKRLRKMIDEDCEKRGETRTGLITHWLWGKVLPSNKRLVIQSTKE